MSNPFNISSLPSISDLTSRVGTQKTVMSALAVTFVASFVSMVASGFCAGKIRKSSCGQTDPNAAVAYQSSVTSSVLSALMVLASTGAMAFVLMRKKK